MRRRRLTALTLVALLAFSLLPATTALADDFELTILHTNDTHAHLEPFQPWGEPVQGGVARRKTVIDQVRGEGGNVLLLDAGDAFQGTLYFNVWQGEEEAHFMNALGYDAMCVGNHEFDSGPATLANFIGMAGFPVLSANTDASAEPLLAGLIPGTAVFNVGGQQVGVFGITTPDSSNISSPGPNVVFNDVVASSQAAVAELEAAGANKIIALTHQGYGNDQALAAAVDGIDVIVGGHSHTPLGPMPGAAGPYPTVATTPGGGTVLIVSAYDWGRYLGRLDVGFTADGQVNTFNGAPVFIDESIAEDPTIAADVATFAIPIEDLKNTVIGESAVLLEGTRALVRTGETNLGNLICDAMLWQTQAEGTQIALTNGGGIRASIPPGLVTMGQVLEVLPFGNQISTFGLLGADVLAALENGVSRVEDVAGQFPHVGGLRFMYDPTLPAGARVLGAEVMNPDGSYSPLDPAAVYKMASNDFLRKGGDGYQMFADSSIDPYDGGALLADALAEYITLHSPVAPEVEGRIVDNLILDGTGFSGMPNLVLPGEEIVLTVAPTNLYGVTDDVLVFVPTDGMPADVVEDSLTGGAFPVYGDWALGQVSELYADQGAEAVRALSTEDWQPITGIAWIGTIEPGANELFSFAIVPWFGPNTFALHADFYAHDKFADRLWTGDLNVGWAEPVTWSFLARQDAYVTRFAPDDNFGDAPILNVRQSGNAYSLVQFATWEIPSFASIHSAKLILRPVVSTNETVLDLALYPVEEGWGAGDVTWNTAPAVSDTALATAAVGTTLDPIIVDVTAMVQLWHADPWQNFGAMLSGVGADRVIYSFAASEIGSYPALEVTFQ